MTFQEMILQGIPHELPPLRERDETLSHAPKRKDILSTEEKKLAVKNALRYFNKRHHATLAPEFYQELETYGRIYMYRLTPPTTQSSCTPKSPATQPPLPFSSPQHAARPYHHPPYPTTQQPPSRSLHHSPFPPAATTLLAAQPCHYSPYPLGLEALEDMLAQKVTRVIHSLA